jgi:hypothetical protein
MIAEAMKASGLAWRVERGAIAVDRGGAGTVDDCPTGMRFGNTDALATEERLRRSRPDWMMGRSPWLLIIRSLARVA